MGSGVTEPNYDRHAASDEVLEAMAFRCKEQGHDYYGAAGPRIRNEEFRFLAVWMACRWCGHEKDKP